MTSNETFWALVRHEFKLKGSWRKQNRSPIAKWWWIGYVSLLLVGAIAVTAYFAINSSLKLEYLWFATLGLPYILFFLGFGSLKREWENDTYGWWLTLPYPRVWLVGAKWLACLMRTLLIVIGILALGTLYATIIAVLAPSYSLADVGSFILLGGGWLLTMIGFSPLLTILGMLTAGASYTALRPITPVLWVLFMGGGGMIYADVPGDFGAPSAYQAATAPTMSWNMLAAMVAGWFVAYLVIRLVAYLLEKKLRL